MGVSAINANKRIQAYSRCVCVVEDGYNDFSFGCFGFEVLLRHAGENVILRISV